MPRPGVIRDLVEKSRKDKNTDARAGAKAKGLGISLETANRAAPRLVLAVVCPAHQRQGGSRQGIPICVRTCPRGSDVTRVRSRASDRMTVPEGEA